MSITETEFTKLDLNSKFELLSNKGLFVGNRVYYNHRVNLYSVNGYFVEVHYSPEANEIDAIDIVDAERVINGYQNRITLKF